jgi:predicted nuclease of predicted toxin-antitoxin system
MSDLRFLADHCIPNSIANLLKHSGYKVFKLRTYLRKDATDKEVIKKAFEMDTILISLDDNFCDTKIYPPKKFNGIVALQIKNNTKIFPDIMNELILLFNEKDNLEDYYGKLFIVEPEKVQIKF